MAKNDNFLITKDEFIRRINPLFKEGLTYEKLIAVGIPSQILDRLSEFGMCGVNEKRGYFWISIHNNYKHPGCTVDNMRDDLWTFKDDTVSPCGYTYTKEDTEPKEIDEVIVDDCYSESFLENINLWFYNGYQNLFEKRKISPMLVFNYFSLKVVQVQNCGDYGETHIYEGDTPLCDIQWQACSISGRFYDKEKALGNKDFKKLIDDLTHYSPLEPDINDWLEY